LDLIKLRARLDIQRFEEWEGEGGIPGLGNNYKPIQPTSNSGGGADGGRFFIQGSKMNGGEFDEGMDGDQPF
jgi:replicative DNA helicase